MSHVFTEITGVASMFGCVCMLFVCAAQLKQLFEAALPRTRMAQPWDMQRPAFQTVSKQAVLF